MSLDLLLDLGLPGIVFLALCVWLVRKVVRAARTERDLEAERFEGTFAEELKTARARADAAQRPGLAPVPPPPDPVRAAMESADLRGAQDMHVRLLEELLRQGSSSGSALPGVLWIRSNAAHVAWCERYVGPDDAIRDVICVARVEESVVVERWSFG
jgi:hypothetical protein